MPGYFVYTLTAFNAVDLKENEFNGVCAIVMFAGLDFRG